MHVIRRSTTVSGRFAIVVGGECSYPLFRERATTFAREFGLTLGEFIDGPREGLVIARFDDAEFCLSWDEWSPELHVMAWRDTPDCALEALVNAI